MPSFQTYLARLDAAQSAHELGEIEEAYYATAAENGWSKRVLRILDDRRRARAIELVDRIRRAG